MAFWFFFFVNTGYWFPSWENVRSNWYCLLWGGAASLPFSMEGSSDACVFRSMAHFISVLLAFSEMGAALYCFIYSPLMTTTNQILIFLLLELTTALIGQHFLKIPCLCHLTLVLLYLLATFLTLFFLPTFLPLEIYDPLGLFRLAEARFLNVDVDSLPMTECFVPVYIQAATSLVFFLLVKAQYPLFNFNMYSDSLPGATYTKGVVHDLISRLNQLLFCLVLLFVGVFLGYMVFRFILSPIPVIASFFDFYVAHFSINFFFGLFFFCFLHTFISADITVLPCVIWVSVWTKDNPEITEEFSRNLRQELTKEYKTIFWPMLTCVCWSFAVLLVLSLCASVVYAWWLGLGWFYVNFFLFLFYWVLIYCALLSSLYVLNAFTIVLQKAWLLPLSQDPWENSIIDLEEYKKALRKAYLGRLLEYSLGFFVFLKFVSPIIFAIII